VETRRLSVPGTDDGVRRALDALAALWAEHGLSRAVTWPMDVSLDEVLANVVRHGPADRGGEACVELALSLDVAVTPPLCELLISDDGPAFDPLAAPAPDTSLGLDERPVGGLGLLLVRRLMDDVAYERRDGRNHLRLRRRLVAVEA
jgi:anti-sigma regulatory factor (Ser/Thr protein kinase)